MLFPRAYLQLVYELAVWRELQGRLMAITANARESRTEIVAHEAPYLERFVTVKVVSEMLDRVLAKEQALMDELALWEWVRKPGPSGSGRPGRRG
jgi:hypothetical protein